MSTCDRYRPGWGCVLAVASCRLRASNKSLKPTPPAFGLRGGLAQPLDIRGSAMPNGKPHDHPVTDTVSHGLHPFPPDIEDLVQQLHARNRRVQ